MVSNTIRSGLSTIRWDLTLAKNRLVPQELADIQPLYGFLTPLMLCKQQISRQNCDTGAPQKEGSCRVKACYVFYALCMRSLSAQSTPLVRKPTRGQVPSFAAHVYLAR